MKINVKHVAKLANLPLSSDEEKKYSEQLSKILDYIEQLNKVDILNVEPTLNVSGKNNVMRKDEVGECLTQDEALLNVKQKREGFFSVKKIFEDE